MECFGDGHSHGALPPLLHVGARRAHDQLCADVADGLRPVNGPRRPACLSRYTGFFFALHELRDLEQGNLDDYPHCGSVADYLLCARPLACVYPLHRDRGERQVGLRHILCGGVAVGDCRCCQLGRHGCSLGHPRRHPRSLEVPFLRYCHLGGNCRRNHHLERDACSRRFSAKEGYRRSEKEDAGDSPRHKAERGSEDARAGGDSLGSAQAN
mmetsp:Transcript_26009/g.55025  ORF Transcript_26009/g.55025 Transcript_26009/m.55025 type:complete len:212 (+) Transcript_26009:3260-3895(+)